MALPLLAMGLSAAPSIISGIGQLFGGKRRKKQENKAAGEISKLSDVFSQQLNQDYFDTGEAQGAIQEFENYQDGQMDEINAAGNINGLTDEAKISMMGNANKNAQGFFANLARSGQLWRQNLLNQKQGALSSLYQIGQNNRQNFNNSLSNIVNPLQQSIDTGFTSGAFDGLLGKTQKPQSK